MEMFDEPDFDETKLTHLKYWAKTHGVSWTKVNSTHIKYRANVTDDRGTRFIAIGATLKTCLWMAFKIISSEKK